MNAGDTRFLIPRTTGTHGDVFAAVGLADLLTKGSDSLARIRENVAGFEISAILGDEIPQTPGYPFLKVNENVKVPAGVTDFVDYKAEKANSDRRKKLTQGKTTTSFGPEIVEQLKLNQPRSDWRLLQVLNTLQGDETSNRVYAHIVQMNPAEYQRMISAALESVASFQPSRLDWPANSVQLFSPISAKGYTRLKPDSIRRNDKTKRDWTDPFIEWLRYRGYFAVACPFFEGAKAENVRLLCPIPADISINGLRKTCDELRQASVFGGPSKLDILAILKLTELLIRRSEEFHDTLTNEFAGISLLGRSPAKVISGISVTQYQSLGSAKGVSSISTLAIPGWLTLNSTDDARTFLSILYEHQVVIRSLRDDTPNEIGLLLLYRRFLELRADTSISALIEFMSRYAALILKGREHERKIPQFSTDNLQRLVMPNAPKLVPVLSAPGFQAVATAIRNATVIAHAQKAKFALDYRAIRYDLLPELRRKSSLPGDTPLIRALSDFISQYNIENARRREQNRSAACNITTDEFAALIALVETHHAATVGPLLCAYGSCHLSQDRDAC